MLRFRDFCTLSLGEAAEGRPLPFLYSDALNVLADTAENKVSLLVTIDATFSGYLLNDRVYPGKFVSDHRSWGSWISKDRGGTAPYDKPILTHHKQTDGDPIGRVVAAKFIRLWEDEDRFLNDYRAPATDYVAGSGKIVIDALITDPEAQARIVDGRYMTFSSGQTTSNAWCSICKHDVRGTGQWCEHTPGQAYEVDDEGTFATAYLITGYLDYLEGSFVNIPANSFAKVTSITEVNEKGQEVEKELGLPKSDHFGYISADRYARVALVDTKGGVTELIRPEGAEDHIPYGKGNVRKSSAFSTVEIDLAATGSDGGGEKDFMDYETFAEANVARSMFYSGDLVTDRSEKVSDRTLYSPYTLFRTITDEKDGHRHVLDLEVNLQTGEVRGYTTLTSDEASEHYHNVAMKLEDLNALKKGVKGETGGENGDSGGHTHKFKVTFGATDSEEFMSLEDLLDRVALLEEAIRNGRLTDAQVRRLNPFVDDLEVLEAAGVDAKLTAGQRKKLKSSTFCGPDRSFPVPDCAHVRAARRLIGRFKGDTSTKQKVMTCVNNKAKRLGCDKGKDAETGGVFALFLNKEKEMSGKTDDKGTPTPPAEAPENQDQRTISNLNDQVEELKERNKELQSLSDSRQAQLDTRTEELTEARTDLRKAFAAQLVLARMLTQHPDAADAQDPEGYQGLVDSYAERTIESLQDAVKDSLPALQAVAKKLTDGKATFLFDETKPEPPVETHADPTNKGDDDGIKDDSASPDPTEEDLDSI